MDKSVKFVIEKAVPRLHSEDIEQLIRELAAFERMPDGPKLTTKELKDDLENGYCYAYVAMLTEAYQNWCKGAVIGYLLYYYAYSTWEGRHLFIEDVYVKPELRRFGIGSALWNTATKIAYNEKLPRIEWNVLAWNDAAIQFYSRMGAVDLHKRESWVRFRLDRASIEKIAKNL